MELFKVIGVGLVGVCATLLLKNTDNRYAILAGIATGAVILIVALNSLSGVIVQLHALVDKTGVDSELFAPNRDPRYSAPGYSSLPPHSPYPATGCRKGCNR